MTNDLLRPHRLATKLIYFGLLLLVWPLVTIAFWGLDRKPPLSLVEYTYTHVRQGAQLELHAKVKRDIDKGCSVTYARYILDSTGNRSNESQISYMNSKGMMEMAAKMGRDNLNILYPLTTELHPGPATYIVMLDWQCNPLHAIWPIQQVIEIPFNVLPKEDVKVEPYRSLDQIGR